MTDTATELQPLVSLAQTAERLGIGRTALWERIDRDELPVVHTANRKRWVPLRALEPREWAGPSSFSRQELADLIGVSYATVVRAVVEGFIPVMPDGRIPGFWVAKLCDPAAHKAAQEMTFV